MPYHSLRVGGGHVLVDLVEFVTLKKPAHLGIASLGRPMFRRRSWFLMWLSVHNHPRVIHTSEGGLA